MSALWQDGDPCAHPDCTECVTPCSVCGRIGARGTVWQGKWEGAKFRLSEPVTVLSGQRVRIVGDLLVLEPDDDAPYVNVVRPGPEGLVLGFLERAEDPRMSARVLGEELDPPARNDPAGQDSWEYIDPDDDEPSEDPREWAPEHLWLQDDVAGERTWCSDKINNGDVLYVRVLPDEEQVLDQVLQPGESVAAGLLRLREEHEVGVKIGAALIGVVAAAGPWGRALFGEKLRGTGLTPEQVEQTLSTLWPV